MKLRFKLFLFVGSLLLVICLAVYLVPLYVAYRQREVERKGYDRELAAEQQRVWQANFDFISGEMGKISGDVDAFLTVVHNYPGIIPSFVSEEGQLGVWSTALRLISHTSNVNYLQFNRSPLPPASVALLNFNHYWAYEEPINDRLSWVTISSRRWYDPLTWQTPWFLPKELIQYTFLGIRLPTRESTGELDYVFEKEGEPSFDFLLFWPKDLYAKPNLYRDLLSKNQDKIDPMMEDLLTQLVDAQAYLAKTFDSPKSLGDAIAKEQARVRLIKTEFSLEEGAIGVRTDTDSELIARTQFFTSFIGRKMRVRALNMAAAPAMYASMGVVWTSPTDPTAATAVARIEPGSQQGGAIFVSEIFSEKGIFDAEAFYQAHPPATEALPIANGIGFVIPPLGFVNLVNALRFHISKPELLATDGYLTAGIAILELTEALQTITGLPTVLMADGKSADWGNLVDRPVTPERFIKAVEEHQFDQNHGFATLAGEEYYYYRYQPRPDWNLYYLTFAPATEVRAPYELFRHQADRLRHRVSLNILWFAGAVFVIAAVLLLWIARRFTRPLTQLAHVTEHIRKGQYEQVELPKTYGRDRNEIHLLTHSFAVMIDGLQERNKMRSVLDKVVSKEIAHEILKGQVELGGEVKEACVLFADIRGFTELSERMTPSEIVAFINSWMTEMTHIIEEHHGVIDKYIGDEIMALFGVPLPLENSSLQAIKAGVAMIERLREWNKERESAGKFPVEIGIGIHYGPMVVGNVGAEDRLNYTVMGPNVNIASRLCDIARPMEILVPKSITDTLPQVSCLSRGEVELASVPQPLQICAIQAVNHA